MSFFDLNHFRNVRRRVLGLPVHPDWRARTFRLWTASALALSVWTAWPLFANPIGPALLVSAAIYCASPRLGFLFYVLCYSFAVADSPARLQPQFIAFALAMPAGFAGIFGRQLLALHLGALWFYAGLWKISSPSYLASGFISDAVATFSASGPVAAAVRGLGPLPVNASAALVELVLGSVVLIYLFRAERDPQSGHLVEDMGLLRRCLLAGGMALHAGILALLVNTGWNAGVWPWNAFSIGAALFAFGTPLKSASVSGFRLPAFLLLGYPLFYLVGLADPQGSWNLYSESVPAAHVCRAQGSQACVPFRPEVAPGVPLPPIDYLLRGAFDEKCSASETLVIAEQRAMVRLFAGNPRPYPCAPRASARARFP